jgi:hypothetical protein
MNDQYLDARSNFLFNHTFVIDGQVAGSWRRTVKKGAVIMEFAPFIALGEAEKQALAIEMRRFGEFLNLPIIAQ